MRATPTNDNGKDTKNSNTHGGKFSLNGLKKSSQPAPVEIPAHDELLQLVVEQAAPFDFVEYRYRKDVARDMENNYIAELREKAKGGDGDAVKTLEKLSKGITPKDYKVYVIEHFIETFKEYRFCSYNGLVYGYNGAFWQPIGDSLFSQILGKIAEKYGVPGTTPRDEDFQTKLLRQFHAAADHPTPATIPLVNLKNGTLRIDQHGNAVLSPFDWREFVRYQLPYDYDPEATAPNLQTFFNKVLPVKNVQYIIFEFLGRCFAPDLKTEDKILLMYGQGANGKSVLCEVVTALFGAVNVAHVGIDKLTQSGQTGEFAAVELDGKLLNVATELDSKSVKSDLFKLLASREKIRAAYKRKDAFTMTPPPMVSNCNELPRTGARDLGFYRRLLIIPFDVTIPPGEQNTNLAKELIETELPGFLNLILAGLRRLIYNGGHYTANPAGDKLASELWAESDSVTAFLEDCFNVEVEAPTQYKRRWIYEIFKQYCIDNGRQTMSNKQFFGLLRQRKFQEINGGDRPFVFPHPLTPEWENRYNFPQ
jgi:putative DNA primase/helicase